MSRRDALPLPPDVADDLRAVEILARDLAGAAVRRGATAEDLAAWHREIESVLRGALGPLRVGWEHALLAEQRERACASREGRRDTLPSPAPEVRL